MRQGANRRVLGYGPLDMQANSTVAAEKEANKEMIQSLLMLQLATTYKRPWSANADKAPRLSMETILSLLASDNLRRKTFGIGRVTTMVSMTRSVLPATVNAMLWPSRSQDPAIDSFQLFCTGQKNTNASQIMDPGTER